MPAGVPEKSRRRIPRRKNAYVREERSGAPGVDNDAEVGEQLQPETRAKGCLKEVKELMGGWESQAGRKGLQWSEKGKVDPSIDKLEPPIAHPLFEARCAGGTSGSVGALPEQGSQAHTCRKKSMQTVFLVDWEGCFFLVLVVSWFGFFFVVLWGFFIIWKLENHQQDKDKSQCYLLWGRRMVNLLIGKMTSQKLMAVAKTINTFFFFGFPSRCEIQTIIVFPSRSLTFTVRERHERGCSLRAGQPEAVRPQHGLGAEHQGTVPQHQIPASRAGQRQQRVLATAQ